ncbi:uncharacterized protein LOC108248836 isoform X2 [Kryptolebias marmoratus]|nr:uncharacterized protein LOC108248836 isoform X2 [Kryptolebias marmoratus]XP_024866776.1 uncharacterized protein LOC108248836 isoform X2 [Kryptolebias marmoratus]
MYPEPVLIWQLSPSFPAPTIDRTEEGLYNISSSMTLSDGDSDLDYSCTVDTGKSKKKVILFKQAFMNSADTEMTIDCQASDTSPKSLIWRFNKSQVILTRSQPEDLYKPSKKWDKYVKTVSKTGSLTLQDLSPAQDGIYTCELNDAEETFLKDTILHNIEIADGQNKPAIIAAAVVIPTIILLAIIVALWKKGVIKFCQKFKPVSTEVSPEEKLPGSS